MDLTTLLNTYRGPLIGLIASWGVPWGDAIEIAQDSFADAWLKRESCRDDWNDPEVFGRWLRGVALNRYRNWSRSRWRRRLRMVSLAPAALEMAAARSELEPSEQVQALRRAIERLPARQRQVVLMHYLEETSVNDVASLLSVSSKTVEGRLYQARRTLRRLLDDRSALQIGKMLRCL
jgi:RNA polymerase sigma-70 factor (ECF subfamily)